MNQTQSRQPLISDERISRTLTPAEFENTTVTLGRTMPLAVAVNSWAHAVLVFRDIALGEDGFNPFDRTPDDLVGFLYLRQAIHSSLRDDSGTERYLPQLAASDELYVQTAEPDPSGIAISLTHPRERAVLLAQPEWWWWHRFPSRGAIADEVRARTGAPDAQGLS